ncbi:MAG: hypothetical protein ABR576_16915 [Thermoanaerobaculia bacterium]
MRRMMFLSAALALVGSQAIAAEVVVLRGGTRIELKKPWVRQGNNALLTRADGTLLSVPVAEIDREATAVAQSAPALPPRSAEVAVAPASPAEAARAGRDRPKARVRVTDADVGHHVESPVAAPTGEEKRESPSGAGRLEVVDYTQERAAGQMMVRGSLRNAGGTTATASRLTISALNAEGLVFVSAEASLSNGTIEPHRTVNFTANLPVGEQPVASLRFAPRWNAVTPPQPAPAAGAAGTTTAAGEGNASAAPGSQNPDAAAPAAAAARPDRARPQTPPGQGVLYAAPPPSASFSPPADGRSGYIPGAASADQQPKPPQ